MEKIKIKISTFLANILENDAVRFGYFKDGKSNKNAFLNKLIPILLEVRKEKRNQIERILRDEYNRSDSEKIYSAVNTVIDRVYFNEGELNDLEEYIWIRPTRNNTAVFNEIEHSEIFITAQDVSTYIRGLLNEYSILPQYKREMLAFDQELDVFDYACNTRQIFSYTNKKTGCKHKTFAFAYYIGYLYAQINLCVVYDLKDKVIRAVPVQEIQDVYTIKQKYKPNQDLLEQMQLFCDNCDFDKEIVWGDK